MDCGGEPQAPGPEAGVSTFADEVYAQESEEVYNADGVEER